jgi:arylformamidase
MGFDNMPDLGSMLMPGAPAYAQEFLALAQRAAESHAHEMDIAYGADAFQRLDVWGCGRGVAGGMPVIMFIHGGAFRNGHKEWNGAMAPALAALPALLVSPNYRLMPRVKAPDMVEDCFDALAWVYRNIARYGGDPSRIYVGGHSAGGYLACMQVLLKAELDRRQIPRAAIRGCLPVSSVFSMLRDARDGDSPVARFWPQLIGDDRLALAYTAFTHTAGNHVPFYIALGDREPSDIARGSREMAEHAASAGFLFGLETFSDSDHFDAHRRTLDANGPWLRSVAKMIGVTPPA